MTKYIILFIVILFFQITAFSQSYKEHRGDIYAARFNYHKATELYKLVMANEPENYFVMKKLAECSRQTGDDSTSIFWYKKLIDAEKHENIDLYNYASSLKNVGEYDKAGKILVQYADNKTDDKYLLSDSYVDKLSRDASRFKISLVEQSSPEADFAPAYFGSKIVFASSRQGVAFMGREYERDGSAFLQLYVADTFANGQLDSIRPFDNKFNTRFHEGPVNFCSADSTMYFTRNNYKFFKGMSADGQVKLKIYQSKFTYSEWLKNMEDFMDSVGIKTKLSSDDWRSVKEFQYNSNDYSTGHPTLTADGKRMYFVSDMPGGMGNTDLYVCNRIGKNDWSEPINLKNLNTEGNEMFPFIHESGVLFFASDGWPGIGGLDIFKALPDGDGFKKPENMGAPLNSDKDDFSLIADTETKTGYFTSNRPEGKGGDDLFHIVFNNKVEYVLAGTASEKYSHTAIDGARISIIDNNSGTTIGVVSNCIGFYATKYNIKNQYTLLCEKEGYFPVQINFDPAMHKLVNDTVFIPFELDFYGIYGYVFIKGSEERVPNVTLSIMPENTIDTLRVISDEKGEFKALLKDSISYSLLFTKDNFLTIRASYSTVGRKPGWVNVNEFIELEIEAIDTNKTIEIPNIYYDVAKWNIRSDAALELNKVVQFMVDNATLTIELGSHTDARGSASSNQSLSQKRAESAVAYIVNQGISQDRIVAKGYGEQSVKNRCAEGVKCSEAEHQENRRTEIRITSF